MILVNLKMFSNLQMKMGEKEGRAAVSTGFRIKFKSKLFFKILSFHLSYPRLKNVIHVISWTEIECNM